MRASDAAPPAQPLAVPRRRRREALLLALGALGLAASYGPMLAGHVRHGIVQGVINDDSRQWISPFLDPPGTLFHDDLLQAYQMALTPPLMRLLYSTPVDPLLVCRVVPYVFLLVFLAGIGLAAARFGGVLAALAALALGLAWPIFLSRMTGGLARSFAFPVLACGLAALVHGRLRWVAVATLVGAASYAPTSPMLGVPLALTVLVFPPAWRGDLRGWSLPRRLVLVAATAALSLLVQVPTLLAARPYGASIGPADVGAFPEAGIGGRDSREDAMPFPSLRDALLTAVMRESRAPLDPAWLAPRLFAAAGLLVAVLLVCGRGEPAVPRLLAFALWALASYPIAARAAPWFYLPERYIRYPLWLAAALLLVAAPALLLRRLRPAWLGGALGAAALGLWLWLGPHGDASAGLNTSTQRTPLIAFLAALPPDALIAGWPPAMDSVPLLTRRRVLVTQENSNAFHTGYTLTMRARTEALIAAYLAADATPLRTLRDQFGVTHLVVDARDLAKPPAYFHPFDAQIAQLTHDRPPATYVWSRLADDAVFRAGDIRVFDLRTLPLQ
jgi:hypothetical protein